MTSSIGSRRRSSRWSWRSVLLLLGRGHREHEALGAGPTGATGAVHVVLVGGGRVVLQHAGDAVDVDAAGGDVGGDQHVHVAAAERAEGALALALAAVAVDGLGADAGLLQLLGQAVGAVLGAGEHDGRPHPLDERGGDRDALAVARRTRSGG